MHAFVDLIDLRNMPFVDALRAFLQAFRLPGEAQKIDRFLLKFAERYIEGNANSTFANAGVFYLFLPLFVLTENMSDFVQIPHTFSRSLSSCSTRTPTTLKSRTG